jgi:hypothetical protein
MYVFCNYIIYVYICHKYKYNKIWQGKMKAKQRID